MFAKVFVMYMKSEAATQQMTVYSNLKHLFLTILEYAFNDNAALAVCCGANPGWGQWELGWLSSDVKAGHTHGLFKVLSKSWSAL